MGSFNRGGRGQDLICNWPFRDISQDAKGRKAELGRQHRRCRDGLSGGCHVIEAVFGVYLESAAPYFFSCTYLDYRVYCKEK